MAYNFGKKKEYGPAYISKHLLEEEQLKLREDRKALVKASAFPMCVMWGFSTAERYVAQQGLNWGLHIQITRQEFREALQKRNESSLI